MIEHTNKQQRLLLYIYGMDTKKLFRYIRQRRTQGWRGDMGQSPQDQGNLWISGGFQAPKKKIDNYMFRSHNLYFDNFRIKV